MRWCLAVPEHGAAGVYFPIDDMTLRYLRLTGRDEVLIRRVEAYAKCQMLWRYPDAPVDPSLYDEVIEFDLSNVEPSLAGPNRPEQRVSLSGVRGSFARAFGERTDDTSAGTAGGHSLANGDVVIAVITSCTNTANPTAMPVAGLLAPNFARLGLKVKSLVKMSFAPGSVVVRGYMQAAGLQGRLDALGFHIIGFGCTTCNGNSGPLAPGLEDDIVACGIHGVAVLSGNRNFEGRIHPLVRAAYLASPALVIAYALDGITTDHLSPNGAIRPHSPAADYLAGRGVKPEDFGTYSARRGNHAIAVRGVRGTFANAHLLNEMVNGARRCERAELSEVWPSDAEVAVCHPWSLPKNTMPSIETANSVIPAGRTFSSRAHWRALSLAIRQHVPRATGITTLWPEGRTCSIFEAGSIYIARGVHTIIIAGKSFGSGSSRDGPQKGSAISA